MTIRNCTLVLLALSIASLGLVSTVDEAAYSLLAAAVSHGAGGSHLLQVSLWLIRARVTSCVLCVLIWVAVSRTVRPNPIGGKTHWRRAAWIAVGWLIGTVVAIYGVGVYVPSLPRSEDVAAFIGFGLLAEELLFRGALFSLSSRVFPTRATPPITWTAALFSVQHLQYHHFHPDAHALTQIAYTLPMGLVLGYVRSATQRLWPGVLVHVLNNAVTLLHVA